MDSRADDRAPRAPGRGDSGPLLFVLGLLVGLLAAILVDRLTSRVADPDIELIRAVRNLAMRDFVEEVDPDDLADNALRGMLGGLDEYSDFYGPREVETVSRETTGTFRGIGVVFRRSGPAGQVLFPFPGSPAARADVRIGDRILSVDDVSVDDMEPGGLQQALQHPTAEDGSVLAQLQALDGTTRQVTLHPEPLLDPTVRHARMLDRAAGVGYLSILAFSHRTPEEFDRAVEELRTHGLRSLVIDLRGNPGGILDAAVTIANRFVREGMLVTTRSRESVEEQVAEPEEATDADLDVVVLVDGASASASEVLAGALQDHGVAVLVGTHTYGKGTVQTLHEITDGRGIIKLTTANYFTPSGRAIRRDPDGGSPPGIAPDELVEVDRETSAAVHAYLQSYSPPADSIAALESWEEQAGEELYERPPQDPQVDAALALLGAAPGEHRADEED